MDLDDSQECLICGNLLDNDPLDIGKPFYVGLPGNTMLNSRVHPVLRCSEDKLQYRL